jgi:hypothetical protein
VGFRERRISIFGTPPDPHVGAVTPGGNPAYHTLTCLAGRGERVYRGKEADMVDLTTEEIRALGHAVGLEIPEPELTEVTYSLNALLEALEAINPAELEYVEPLPI